MNRNAVKEAVVWTLVFLVMVSPGVVFAVEGIVPCDGSAADPCTFGSVMILINRVIDFLIKVIALPISALLFAYAGFLYLTAAGDEGQVKKAHGVFKNVFVGLILALAAWLIINLVISVLTGQGLNFFLNKQS